MIITLICLVQFVFSAIGTVVEEQNEKMFTHLAQQIHPIVSDKRAIVYLDAAKHVPRLTIALRQLGLKSCGYHGKNMSSHDKLKALENWKSGDIDAMVSTSAFGMGIDRADVDVVLKIGVPQSLEDLVQMFGRAGRDGRTAQGEYNILDALVNSRASGDVYLIKVTSTLNFCAHYLLQESYCTEKMIFRWPATGTMVVGILQH